MEFPHNEDLLVVLKSLIVRYGLDHFMDHLYLTLADDPLGVDSSIQRHPKWIMGPIKKIVDRMKEMDCVGRT